MGILLALTALISWGLGDFLIQRSARKFGDWVALFYITAFGAIILFPFALKDLAPAFASHSILLWLAAIVTLLFALLDFEALRIGKISVIEPVYAFEIPIAALLAAYFAHEQLTATQILLIFSVMLGIFLISTRSFSHFKRIHLEKGAWFAAFATIGMGIANFLFGVGSRATSPLMINWFVDVFVAVACIVYLLSAGRAREIIADFKNNRRLILTVSFFDNLAWVAFSSAMLFIPIAVATGISEGYIAFAGGLGLIFNREKLKKHQWAGFLLAAVAVIALAIVTDK
jgi:drug/metabolite transporter (DMT)-like permease